MQMQLPLHTTEADAAELTQPIAVLIHPWAGTTLHQQGTYTAVNTGPMSIVSRERGRWARVGKPASMQLTVSGLQRRF